ncbi:ABC transporter permease [Nocardia sp. bgisy118]|uniref:ABC transporter permease n=1 Tax=Nocardia sp. bgisy118 TaxID=3413786 RepID=UPI003F49BF6F
MSHLIAASARTILDNRSSYLSFGAAWLVGHGAFALAHGDDPLVDLPGPVPMLLLGGGLLAALAITGAAAGRARRTATADPLVSGLLAASWVIGFGALFVVITALSSVIGDPAIQTLLWPTGSGVVVGLLYLAGGVAYRDVLQYSLGAWLALVSGAALFFHGANLYWLLALAGGGSYLLAAALEPRRLAAAHA